MEYSMTTQFFMELLETLILVLFRDGACACVMLNKSKGQNPGWIVITIAWSLTVCMGVFIAGPYMSTHPNPAVSADLVAAGMFPWSSIPIYAAGQMIGGILGAILVWIFYKDHYDATDNNVARLSTFCIAPVTRNYKLSFLCEVIVTLVFIFIIISSSSRGNCCDPRSFKFGLVALGPVPATLLIIALGVSLDGPTGYAMNPARDLSPRIAHAFCMRGDNDWAYAQVPVPGSMVGGIIAGLCDAALHQL